MLEPLRRTSRRDSDVVVTDLFRVADGRIVEHWDVMETITSEDTWVNSGKF